MATGLPFTPDIDDVIKAIIAKKGVVTNVAKHFEVHKETIYDYCYRHPEALEALEKVRKYNKFDYLDMAEHVTMYNMINYETNPGLAQRASEKVLDKLGHLRGWHENKSDDASANSKQDSDRLSNALKAKSLIKECG